MIPTLKHCKCDAARACVVNIADAMDKICCHNDTYAIKDEMFQNRCMVCNNPSTRRCSSCKAAFYCSDAHQQADWNKSHRFFCKIRILQQQRNAPDIHYLNVGEEIARAQKLISGPVDEAEMFKHKSDEEKNALSETADEPVKFAVEYLFDIIDFLSFNIGNIGWRTIVSFANNKIIEAAVWITNVLFSEEKTVSEDTMAEMITHLADFSSGLAAVSLLSESARTVFQTAARVFESMVRTVRGLGKTLQHFVKIVAQYALLPLKMVVNLVKTGVERFSSGIGWLFDSACHALSATPGALGDAARVALDELTSVLLFSFEMTKTATGVLYSSFSEQAAEKQQAMHIEIQGKIAEAFTNVIMPILNRVGLVELSADLLLGFYKYAIKLGFFDVETGFFAHEKALTFAVQKGAEVYDFAKKWILWITFPARHFGDIFVRFVMQSLSALTERLYTRLSGGLTALRQLYFGKDDTLDQASFLTESFVPYAYRMGNFVANVMNDVNRLREEGGGKNQLGFYSRNPVVQKAAHQCLDSLAELSKIERNAQKERVQLRKKEGPWRILSRFMALLWTTVRGTAKIMRIQKDAAATLEEIARDRDTLEEKLDELYLLKTGKSRQVREQCEQLAVTVAITGYVFVVYLKASLYKDIDTVTEIMQKRPELFAKLSRRRMDRLARDMQRGQFRIPVATGTQVGDNARKDIVDLIAAGNGEQEIWTDVAVLKRLGIMEDVLNDLRPKEDLTPDEQEAIIDSVSIKDKWKSLSNGIYVLENATEQKILLRGTLITVVDINSIISSYELFRDPDFTRVEQLREAGVAEAIVKYELIVNKIRSEYEKLRKTRRMFYYLALSVSTAIVSLTSIVVMFWIFKTNSMVSSAERVAIDTSYEYAIDPDLTARVLTNFHKTEKCGLALSSFEKQRLKSRAKPLHERVKDLVVEENAPVDASKFSTTSDHAVGTHERISARARDVSRRAIASGVTGQMLQLGTGQKLDDDMFDSVLTDEDVAAIRDTDSLLTKLPPEAIITVPVKLQDGDSKAAENSIVIKSYRDAELAHFRNEGMQETLHAMAPDSVRDLTQQVIAEYAAFFEESSLENPYSGVMQAYVASRILHKDHVALKQMYEALNVVEGDGKLGNWYDEHGRLNQYHGGVAFGPQNSARLDELFTDFTFIKAVSENYEQIKRATNAYMQVLNAPVSVLKKVGMVLALYSKQPNPAEADMNEVMAKYDIQFDFKLGAIPTAKILNSLAQGTPVLQAAVSAAEAAKTVSGVWNLFSGVVSGIGGLFSGGSGTGLVPYSSITAVGQRQVKLTPEQEQSLKDFIEKSANVAEGIQKALNAANNRKTSERLSLNLSRLYTGVLFGDTPEKASKRWFVQVIERIFSHQYFANYYRRTTFPLDEEQLGWVNSNLRLSERAENKILIQDSFEKRMKNASWYELLSVGFVGKIWFSDAAYSMTAAMEDFYTRSKDVFYNIFLRKSMFRLRIEAYLPMYFFIRLLSGLAWVIGTAVSDNKVRSEMIKLYEKRKGLTAIHGVDRDLQRITEGALMRGVTRGLNALWVSLIGFFLPSVYVAVIEIMNIVSIWWPPSHPLVAPFYVILGSAKTVTIVTTTLSQLVETVTRRMRQLTEVQ